MTRLLHVYGIVQGVGFRPFTARTAAALGVTGTVANKGSYVEIIAQGSPDALDAFEDTVQNRPPERAMVMGLESESLDETAVFTEFSIIESEHEPGDIFVSPDIAVCPKCAAELFDPADPRYLHPFINCTQCGPRLTILDAMPYDRERTSMKVFPMCPRCAAEYRDPATRRYDAQPVCCNDCGPGVYILGTDLRDSAAISAARRAIMEGKIIAVKGIGGFHLCCDARNAEAVATLRSRKHRPVKPLAVMLRDMETVRRECIVQDEQIPLLTGWQKPILLLEKREDTSLCKGISPDNLTVGVMLPYTPLHLLLFDFPDGVAMTDCLVMTSGNAKGAPICRSDADAEREISGFCDLILSHDRRIRLRADDSVCDWFDGRPYMIRRSRGFAPLPFMLPRKRHPVVLGIGGELKNGFCVAKGGLLYPSPYVGDLADIRTVEALRESVDRMCSLLEAVPELVVCDMHPLYNSVTVAQEIAQARGIPCVQVQHHYAHVLACCAENAWTDPVLGVSYDGTGYGTDGTVWGGELLLCDPHGFTRAGSVEPFIQTGGDLSAKEGWRIAAAILRQSCPDAEALCERLGVCEPKEYRLLARMAELGVNSVRSTSCGRIFDAAAAILGIRRSITFEGEASVALTTAAERYYQHGGQTTGALTPAFTPGDPLTLPTGALLAALAEHFAADPSDANRLRLAAEFHHAMTALTVAACVEIRSRSGISTAALTGGVFQNRVLLRLTRDGLEAAGLTVLRHTLIPPNDGGISLGQAMYGMFTDRI